MWIGLHQLRLFRTHKVQPRHGSPHMTSQNHLANWQKTRSYNLSVNSKPDHPPRPLGDPRGFAHSSCPWGRIFAPLSCPRVLNQSKSLTILKKSAIFALSLKQMGSSSFHMSVYARSEQCDLGPIYTITNTQRIRIYPGKLSTFSVY